MSLLIAVKAFFKAWKDPIQGKQFLEQNLKKEEVDRTSHLQLLSLLQESSRLIDFLMEDIKSFSDEQVGGAVRKIHADCVKSLGDYVGIKPIRDECEGSLIRIEKGYDSTSLKLVGKVKGEPPFSGVLVHKGWKAHKKSLPKKLTEQKEIIFPAEVEIN